MKQPKYGYMCAIDFNWKVGEALGGTIVYPSVEDLKHNRKRVEQCGVVKVGGKMDKCPKCKASWIGEFIAEDIAHHYSGTNWRREIGIDGGLLGVYDGIVALRCPDCKSEFPRNDSKWAKLVFHKYLLAISEQA